MSIDTIKEAVISGEELTFTHGGREHLLYGWEQCDGYVLSLECEGELIWQSIPQTRSACAEEFARYYQSL